MIIGMEKYLGRMIKPDLQKEFEDYFSRQRDRVIITRPDYYSENIHINMYIKFDDSLRITDIDGNKCYSVYKGMYNRSSAVYPRSFTKRDLAFLRGFLKRITDRV